MYVRKDDIRDFGPTPGCNGCRGITNKWTSHMGHNSECRERIRMRLMERSEGRRRVEEADERMRRIRESQDSKTEERAGQQRSEAEPTNIRVPQPEQEAEDIGGDIDPQKWEKFKKKPGNKRSAEGGEENQSKRQHSQESSETRERAVGTKRAREEEATESKSSTSASASSGSPSTQQQGQKRSEPEEKPREESEKKRKPMNMLERQIEKSMQEVLAMDVAEIYSPPRVADCAKEFNLEGGWSLDLTT
eukprot:3295207-Karenia_brevis.AAC.1